MRAKLLQLCLTLCDPMDCSPPTSQSIGTLQAKILEWVAMPLSRGLPDPGIEPTSLLSLALAGSLPRGESQPQRRTTQIVKPPLAFSLMFFISRSSSSSEKVSYQTICIFVSREDLEI